MRPQLQPHPREIIHLYRQPPDKHSSVAHKEVLRCDPGEDTLCKAGTKATAATLLLFYHRLKIIRRYENKEAA